jgi:hypothetical protein
MSLFRPAVLACALTAGFLYSLGLTAGTLGRNDGASTTPATVQPPLDTRAKLDAWLEASRGAPNPLDAFTAGGRQRFLTVLGFGERGVVSLPVSPIAAEAAPTWNEFSQAG